jgi:hypothetical protein
LPWTRGGQSPQTPLIWFNIAPMYGMLAATIGGTVTVRHIVTITVALISNIALAWGAPSPAADEHVLTSRGLGRVHVGMKLRQAEIALGANLRIDGPTSESCGMAERADGRDAGVLYMLEDGRITRVDVYPPKSKSQLGPRVVTAAGLGLGSTESAVRRAYGSALKIEAHPYDERGHYLKIYDAGKQSGIIFETDGERVTSFRAGKYPALGYIEGCL